MNKHATVFSVTTIFGLKTYLYRLPMINPKEISADLYSPYPCNSMSSIHQPPKQWSMNFPNRPLLFLSLFLLLFVACNKDTKTPSDIKPMEIQIQPSQRLNWGDLHIYPITTTQTTPKAPYLIPSEALLVRGFNIKKTIDESILGFGTLQKGSLYFANKSAKPGLILLGDLLQNTRNTIHITKEGAILPAKQITEINTHAFSFKYSETSSRQEDYSYIFPCPPIPLNYLLQDNPFKTQNWLEKALPLLNYTVNDNLDQAPFDFNFFSDNHPKDKEELEERMPQQDIGDSEEFMSHFAAIPTNNTVGCLVTYKDKIVISYLFAQANIFQKEWPNISKSIFLNQLMGYYPKEWKQLTPFEDVETSTRHLQELWSKSSVFPQDNAYRGETNNQPFYLVAF